MRCRVRERGAICLVTVIIRIVLRRGTPTPTDSHYKYDAAIDSCQRLIFFAHPVSTLTLIRTCLLQRWPLRVLNTGHSRHASIWPVITWSDRLFPHSAPLASGWLSSASGPHEIRG
ncbi:hypothetical protein BGW36DRAFT_23339 [Talaromyces proteolyticus]|uniref:Secreted protein n=1 Tax=Talaromyces proteolyticus TaxID=1131652 RepID=A0AAD4KKX0_9EURO|nr:uncharacterized protein BGW36DRAFT_23339 [Talaromyces proteolyticus]KAH8692622.1 hypothetical protein BGW36DRAFT_23339 [Talaromyces proteolyticus]